MSEGGEAKGVVVASPAEYVRMIARDFSRLMANAALPMPTENLSFVPSDFFEDDRGVARNEWVSCKNSYEYAVKNRDSAKLRVILARRLPPLLRNFPRSASLYYFEGLLHWRLDELEAMVAALRRAADLSQLRLYHRSLARAAYMADEVETCFETLQSMFASEPPTERTDEWLVFLGLASQRGDLDCMASVLETTLSRKVGGDSGLHLGEGLIVLLEARKEHDRARAIARDVLGGRSRNVKSIEGWLATLWPHLLSSGQAEEPAAQDTPVGEPALQDEQQLGELPPGGIVASFSRELFGMIRSSSGEDLYFRLEDVVDDELAEKLTKGAWGHCIVAFDVVEADGNRFRRAERVRDIAKQDLPEEPLAADEPQEEPYERARKLIADADLSGAEVLLRRAISEGDHLDSAVFDLADLLVSQGRFPEALQTLREAFPAVSDVRAAADRLAFLFQSADMHADALEMLARLEEDAGRLELPEVLKRKTLSLAALGQTNDAADCLRRAIEIIPEDSEAAQWLELIQQGEDAPKDEQAVTFGKTVLVSLSDKKPLGRLPHHLMMDGWEKLTSDGVVDLSELSLDLIGELEGLAEDASRSHHEERATHCLAAAMGLSKLGFADNDPRLLQDLRQGLRALGEDAESRSLPGDVISAYYSESLSVSPKTTAESWNTLILLFRTLFDEGSKRRKAYKRSDHDIKKLQELLRELLSGGASTRTLAALLRLAAVSHKTRYPVSRAIQNDRALSDLMAKLLGLHKRRGVKDTLLAFGERSREVATELADLSGVCSRIAQASLTAAAAGSWLDDLPRLGEGVLCALDAARLEDLRRIVEHARAFAAATDYVDREKAYFVLEDRVGELLGQIAAEPTAMAYEHFSPAVAHLRDLARRQYEELTLTATPSLSVSLASDACVLEENGVTRIQVSVANADGCGPASRVRVTLTANRAGEFELVECHAAQVESLRGGASHTVLFDIRPSEASRAAQAFATKVSVAFENRLGEENELPSQLVSVRLYDTSMFERIPNRYAPYAEGGAVDDPQMFFGREEIISAIRESLLGETTTKSVVLFGQKRCGKSSLVARLGEALQESDCIPAAFSVGELATDLTETTFLSRILDAIYESLLDNCDWDPSVWQPPTIEKLSAGNSVFQFMNSMRALRARLKESPAGGRRIVLLIDEFSDIYKELLAQTIQRQFMRAWKSITEQRFFSAVLVGQDIMQRFKQDFPNEFGVIEDQRLSYLSFREARDLVEVPVGADRYLPGAVDRILELTAASPYYTMMFCKRLVDYANEHKALKITSAEVNEVLYSLVKGHNRLAPDKFDCLLIAGDSERDSGIPADAALAVCRIVAGDAGMGVCPESVVLGRVPDSAAVLDDLVRREVLERTGDGVRIRVGLFAEWLARN